MYRQCVFDSAPIPSHVGKINIPRIPHSLFLTRTEPEQVYQHSLLSTEVPSTSPKVLGDSSPCPVANPSTSYFLVGHRDKWGGHVQDYAFPKSEQTSPSDLRGLHVKDAEPSASGGEGQASLFLWFFEIWGKWCHVVLLSWETCPPFSANLLIFIIHAASPMGIPEHNLALQCLHVKLTSSHHPHSNRVSL